MHPLVLVGTEYAIRSTLLGFLALVVCAALTLGFAMYRATRGLGAASRVQTPSDAASRVQTPSDGVRTWADLEPLFTGGAKFLDGARPGALDHILYARMSALDQAPSAELHKHSAFWFRIMSPKDSPLRLKISVGDGTRQRYPYKCVETMGRSKTVILRGHQYITEKMDGSQLSLEAQVATSGARTLLAFNKGSPKTEKDNFFKKVATRTRRIRTSYAAPAYTPHTRRPHGHSTAPARLIRASYTAHTCLVHGSYMAHTRLTHGS
jgi:hypothetical protein